MKVNVHGKDVDVSPKTVAMLEEKLSFLNKYFVFEDDQIVNSIIKKVGNKIRIEITIPTRIGTLRAEVTDNELREAVDEAVKRLETQITTQKSRLNRRHKESLASSFVEEETDGNDVPVRTKTVTITEMSLDEAILQMEMLGHSFFIYKDEETEGVAVCYRRYDGGYGLIEVEEAA